MSTIDDVKARVDIVDLVSEQVTLKRAGRNFSGLCPFHSEKTPSFIVSPDRQTWHCFGSCATGGDIFSYVMKREDVEFVDALRTLAQRAGVVLQERRGRDEDARAIRAVAANDAAAMFFHETLLHSKTARHARDYVQDRGLDTEAIETFQIGYSLDSWEALRSHLNERGYSDQELLAVGLLTEGERGPHDRFRGRLMFPIRDERGRTVGFGGRSLVSDASMGAKYINTAQTPMFDKGALLYALDLAKEAVRREKSVIVVEGYMDVIAAHQHGISNVVASMGTALTDRQIRALERFKCKIMLAMDADAAGIEATLRALQEATSSGAVRAAPHSSHPSAVADEDFTSRVQEWSRNGLKRAAVNFYVVPLLGKDPDEMIRKDRASWDDALQHAKPFTDHVFDIVAGRHDLTQPVERALVLQELLPIVRLIEEPVYRAHYIQRLARLSQLHEDTLREELRRGRPQPAGTRQRSTAPAKSADSVREPREEYCLALLLRYEELREDGLALRNDLFSLSEHRAIYASWGTTLQMDNIRESLPEDLHAHLDRILSRDVPFLEGARLRAAFQDCVRRIELRRLTQAKQASTAALSEPDLQQYMSAAVEEAAVLQEARSGDQQQQPDHQGSDSRAHELAETLLEDEELGRRLHQGTISSRSAQRAEVSPHSEVER